MKTFIHYIQVFALLSLVNIPGKSQVLNENFNGGLPVSWAQSPATTWSLNSALGTGGSPCAITEHVNSNSVTATLSTPTLNLSSVTNLTVTFKMAVVGNNFVVPNIVLSFNAGAGPQFLARWGSGFSSNTTYTITTNDYDYQPPLDPEHVTFVTCTQTVSAITGTMASFVFDAEFVNGGYVLIEDVNIAGKVTSTTGLATNEQSPSVLIFPNPAVNKIVTIQGPLLKTIHISDGLGRPALVDYKQTDTAFELDFSKLPNGVYYLVAVSDGNGRICKKIVIE